MNSLLFNDQTHFPPSRVIVALDFQEANMALNFIRQLDPSLCALKVGNELFTSAGPAFIEQLIAQGFRVFLDLKFHDIPNTCLLYTSPSPRDKRQSRMPSSA